MATDTLTLNAHGGHPMCAKNLAFLPTASADPVANPNWQRLRYTRYVSDKVKRISTLRRRNKWLRNDLEVIDNHIANLRLSLAHHEGYVRGVRYQLAYLSSPEFRRDPVSVQLIAAKVAHLTIQGGTQ
ncbi:MAG: hypothetical protein Q7T69_02660 [Rhodoferax sp.]|nr:hypothetical protein [Rhodoferax sp.]